MGISRRSFVRSAVALAPAAVLANCGDAEVADAPRDSAPDAAEQDTLLALAAAVLPSELGTEGTEKVVAEFREWLAAYQPVAELNHGYGTAEIDYTPADPAPGWMAQLRALELEAKQRFGSSFAALEPGARREIVRSQVGRRGGEGFPMIAEADNVAVGLLAFFYDSPFATDLCYRAGIRKLTCRPLAGSSDKPPPLPVV